VGVAPSKVKIKESSPSERMTFAWGTVPDMFEPTLKQLRSLVAVARYGTISAAAQALHVTAPAVGQQIRLLERAAGTPLTERTPRGLRITDAGREMVATAGRIEAELDSCRETIDQIATGKVGTVSLGAVSTAKYFAPSALAGFWRSHPDVDVRLVIGNRRETIAAIEDLTVDITIMGRPPKQLDLDTITIGDHPHLVIAGPEHPCAGRRNIEFASIADEKFLVREQGSGTRSLTDWLFTDAGLTPNIGMEITSNETIKQAVMAGLGLSLLSAHTVAVELAAGRLIALDVVGLPIVRQWHAVKRSQGHLSPAGEALWAYLGAHAKDHLPSYRP
jgi:LysR family transcriptional regulator, low CO2-responsive transcriptional regulator